MFFQGLLLGFSIAAPVGPIGLLCIQRTLARGRLHGFVSGLGAAMADACYGIVAALGLTAVTAFLVGVQFWLQLGGGLFCSGSGSRRSAPPSPASPPAQQTMPVCWPRLGRYSC
jgi:threonine/homoserine/homoserine lactone efflux protein